MKRFLSLAIAGLLASSSFGASAATATAVIPVSATALSVCVAAALPLVFGNYSGAQLDASAALTVTCSLGTTYNVKLDAGAGTNASIATRKLAFLSNTIDYHLYRDSNRTQNWGTTIGTDTFQQTSAGLPQVITVYGRITAGQYPTPGAYLDTVNVAVEY